MFAVSIVFIVHEQCNVVYIFFDAQLIFSAKSLLNQNVDIVLALRGIPLQIYLMQTSRTSHGRV